MWYSTNARPGGGKILTPAFYAFSAAGKILTSAFYAFSAALSRFSFADVDTYAMALWYTSTSSSFVPGSAPNAPTMSVAKAHLSIMTSTFGNSLYLSDAQA